MRLAIVAASAYEKNGQVAPIPNAELDVELFGRRLAEADANFTVHAFAAERGLAEGVEALVRELGGRIEALVFYFWGYALLSEERGPTLLLDGATLSPLSLARLRRMLSEISDTALVVLDTRMAEGSVGAPLDVVRAMGRVLSGGDSSVSTLAAVRPEEQATSQGPPAFTGLVQMVLDGQTGSPNALTPELLFRAMQAEEVMFSDIPAAGCFLSQRDFIVVPGASVPSVSPAASSHLEQDEATTPRGFDTSKSRDPSPRPSAGFSAEAYRTMLSDCEQCGDVDGAYRAAACLEALGEADINESLLANTYRPEGLQACGSALSYADWNERLCEGQTQPEVTALLRALGPALIEVGFRFSRRKRRQILFPEEARQDTEKSTTTLAKTLLWASHLLSVPAPTLFVLPEVSGSLALAPGAAGPLVICARSLGSGFSLQELVCLWSRQLAFARPEQSALCYFPSTPELSQLLLAALAVGGAANMRAIDADAKRIASGLRRAVRGAALDELRAAASRFSPPDVSARAEDYIRSAEVVASRVGLVACGDLEVSLELNERFPLGTLNAPEALRADLLRFAVSSELGQVRAQLGVAVASV